MRIILIFILFHLPILLGAQIILKAPNHLYASHIDSTSIDSAYTRGWYECENNISQGKYIYKLWGLPDFDSLPIFVDFLRDTCRIELKGVAGCTVGFIESAEWTGYNKRIASYADSAFRKGIIDTLYNMADQLAPRLSVINRDSVLSLLMYPTRALKKGIQGLVVIKAKLSPHGELSKFRIIKSIGYGCTEEALRLAKLYRFEPFKKSKYAISREINIPINFRIKKSAP
jgi:TonB family protein